jgi:anti-anti-sigma regulatory factor
MFTTKRSWESHNDHHARGVDESPDRRVSDRGDVPACDDDRAGGLRRCRLALGARVSVDLSETTVIDSTSLGVLLGAMKRLREHDGRILLVVPQPALRRVFEITMLDRIFPLHETQEEALTDLPVDVG